MRTKPTIMNRILKLTLAGLSCLIGFTSPAISADTYKIGGIFSVTGRASFLGDPEKKSMEMAIEAINQAGGIDGRLLEPVIYDTEGDPQKAVSGISRLINKDGVIAIIGPSNTPTSLAVKSFAERANIPLISCAAGIAITQPVTPWTFKTAQSDVQAVSAAYAHMKRNNIKTIGILSVADAFGESGKQQLLAQAADFGIKVVCEESFGAKDTDMTTQLTKIRKENPDAIVCWGTNPGPAVVAKNVQQLGITIPLYQSHGVASPNFIKLAGDASEGIYLPTGKILVAGLLPDTDPQKSVLRDYIQQYETRYQQPVSGFGGYAYDAVQMLAKALKGSNGDRNKIRQALENITGHIGISGVFNMSEKEHNGLSPDAFVMVRIQNGTWKLEP